MFWEKDEGPEFAYMIAKTTLILLMLLSVASTTQAQTLTQKLKSEPRATLAKDASEKGSAVRGAILFPQQKLRCAACHVPGDPNQIGPDLTRLGKDATAEHLIEALLEPTKTVRKGYEASRIITDEGRDLTGRIIEQGNERIAFRDVIDPAKVITLPTDEIEEIIPSNLSAMPDGLMDQLSDRQEFLDLVRYLIDIAATGDQNGKSQTVAKQELGEELRGLVLLDRLNCVACHIGDWELMHTTHEYGPNLSWSTQHLDPNFIRRFIANPSAEKLGTNMPHMLDHLDKSERAAIATAITNYLVSLSDKAKFQRQPIDHVAAKRGEQLFHTVGCVACHSPRDEDGAETLPEDSVPLGNLNPKHNLAGLTSFLENPHVARPARLMPNMQLTHWEARDIANYLLTETQVTGSLQYTTYEGSMHEGFDRLTGKEDSAGIADAFSLAEFERYRSDFAVVFDGFLEIESPGRYVFYLECNDAGRLLIDGKSIVSMPPQPGDKPQSATQEIELTVGTHSIQLTYLQLKNEASLNLELSGANLPKGPIPRQMLRSHKEPNTPAASFKFDNSLVEKGRTHFNARCIQCHVLDERADEKFATVGSDNLNAGCLSGNPGPWPRYELTESERNDIRAAMRREDATLTSDEQIAVTLTRLRCVACHERDGLGGAPSNRDSHFHTSDPNLGPQGRIPPRLTDVGAKLKPAWMRNVLVNAKAIRPYMLTRMPQFGERNVEHLVELFGESDTLPDIEFGKITDRKKSRDISSEMVGNKGLNCVACHTYRLKPSQTMSAVDLTEMAERLNKRWFFHYLRDPQRISPRTVMPSFWPGGQAIRPDVLEGDSTAQIEHLWYYLQDGRQARAPRGMKSERMELLATNEAVMLRRKYQGIGKRGIGVGYPSQANLAFDAEQMRLAMVWKGKFADPGGVWRGQGSGNVRPAGERPIQFTKGPDLDDASKPWVVDDGRPPKHQFLGYVLDELQRPKFMYRFDGIEVEDYFVDIAVKDAVTLQRTVTLRSEQDRNELVFRVASGENIEAEDDGRFLVNDKIHVRITSDVKPEIRETLTEKLLVIPATASKGETKFIMEYSW